MVTKSHGEGSVVIFTACCAERIVQRGYLQVLSLYMCRVAVFMKVSVFMNEMWHICCHISCSNGFMISVSDIQYMVPL